VIYCTGLGTVTRGDGRVAGADRAVSVDGESGDGDDRRVAAPAPSFYGLTPGLAGCTR